MRKISLWLFILVFTASLARAQDDAAQQQIDKLSGQVQDLLDAQAAQGKRIDALEKQIGDLGDKMNQPGGNNFASADDLKNLATQVQEIDKKRQDDNGKILDALDKLGKGGVSTSHKPSTTVSTTTTTDNSPTTGGQQNGYYYPIASGDTIAAIAKAYHAKGVRVTTSQILAANPGLNPNNLKVGQKVFIPDANAK